MRIYLCFVLYDNLSRFYFFFFLNWWYYRYCNSFGIDFFNYLHASKLQQKKISRNHYFFHYFTSYIFGHSPERIFIYCSKLDVINGIPYGFEGMYWVICHWLIRELLDTNTWYKIFTTMVSWSMNVKDTLSHFLIKKKIPQ